MSDRAAAPILMPKLGLTMTEGLLASWMVKPGDEVKRGDILFVVETEKIANEIEAPDAGRILTIHVSEGETVPVGTPLADWTGGGDVAENAAQGLLFETGVASITIDKPKAGAESDEAGSQRILSTPLARRMARERGLDLALIRGSGPRGRIKAVDVSAVGAEAARTSGSPVVGPEARSAERKPASQNRKLVAQRLTLSKQTIPHFYVLAQVDMTRLLALRAELNAEPDQPRVSINHLVVAAAGRALRTMPEFRVLWDAETLLQVDNTDVGIAVDAPSGLIVPVLRDAGSLSLDRLVRDALELVERARLGRLRNSDLTGGALSISNVGMFGASHLVPIINPGQTAILGVGGIKPAFRPDSAGMPELRQEAGLVLSADHRAVDGVLAARFLDRVVNLLEHPLALLRAAEAET